MTVRSSIERTGSRMEQLDDAVSQSFPQGAASVSRNKDPFAEGRGSRSSQTSSAAQSLHEQPIGGLEASPTPSQQQHDSVHQQNPAYSPTHRMTRGGSSHSSWLGHTSYYGYGGASTPATPGGGEPLPAVSGFYSPSGIATPMSAFPSSASAHFNHAGPGASASGANTPGGTSKPRQRKVFKSTVLAEGEEVHKPWLEDKSRKSANRKAYGLFLMGIFIGILAAIAVAYTGWASVKQYDFCLVLDESFSGDAINTDIWFHEQEVGGFGNAQFDWTTDSTNNSYVRDGYLYIVPTLTSDALGMAAITDGYDLNLTTAGTCTASDPNNADACSVRSNATAGVSLPPIQSARLITNFSTSIKYGRVEVRAKMPKGDWIWPAVWMMPKDSVYGAWPRSGEIDILETRGNTLKHKNDDYGNVMHSTLHWGPSVEYDGYLQTGNARQLYRNYFDEDFHTLGLQWTPDGLYTYYDNPNNKVLAWAFKDSFWDLGNFPTASGNGSTLTNPWPSNGNVQAPFDQEFFLILSVAVGGTNGWFDEDDMPWSNDAADARGEFWENRDEWYPTWGSDYERGMVVDSVKMWNLEGVEGVECPIAPITN